MLAKGGVALAHGLENAKVTPLFTGLPPLLTGTLRVVELPDGKALVKGTLLPTPPDSDTLAADTLIPQGLDAIAAAPTDAPALTVNAPPGLGALARILIVAVPVESVRLVPDAGEKSA